MCGSNTFLAILILDGHMTYTKNLMFIKMARENHVIVLCSPSRFSHRLQSLNVLFMSPLNIFYSQRLKTVFMATLVGYLELTIMLQLTPQTFLKTPLFLAILPHALLS